MTIITTQCIIKSLEVPLSGHWVLSVIKFLIGRYSIIHYTLVISHYKKALLALKVQCVTFGKWYLISISTLSLINKNCCVLVTSE